jgi:hypothetical protein
MASLISVVRTNIGDKTTPPTFTDDEIQRALDRRRVTHQYLSLDAQDFISPAGLITYVDFFSPTGGDWDSDVVIVDYSYNTLTPSTADPVSGRWSFSPAISFLPVQISGTRYDTNGASADLLEAWMGLVKKEFSFSRGGRNFQRGEQINAFKELIATYRSRQWITTSEMVRTDMMGGNYGRSSERSF